MPSTWPAEALKAQAIAARSYAARRLRPGVSYYDVNDDTSSQVYRGASGEKAATNRVISATAGVVLRSGSVDRQRAVPLDRRRRDREQRERLRRPRPARRSPAPVSYLRGSMRPRRRTAALRRGVAVRDVGDARRTRRAQLSAWFAADTRTNVGTLTALDLRDRGVSGRLISVTLIGSAARRRSPATSSGRCSTPTGRRATR